MSKNIQKTPHFKAHSKVFLVLPLLLIVLFLTSFASATLKSYDEINKEVTLSTNFLFFNTGDIATVKLDTPLDVRVGAGYQKVAEFTINGKIDYQAFIQAFNFYDYKTKKGIERTIDLKYKTTEQVLINDYQEVCDRLQNSSLNCYNKIIGTHYETKEVWSNLQRRDIKKEEVLTVGIFTDVKVGDKVEWIPTLAGLKVQEWAVWTADLNVGLVSYYAFEEASGNFIDQIGGNNLTVAGTVGRVAGKIGNGVEFNDNNANYLESLNDVGITGAGTRTSCWWSERDTTTNEDIFLSWGTSANYQKWMMEYYDAGTYYSQVSTHGYDIRTSITQDTSYHFNCVTFTGTVMGWWKDGISVSNVTSAQAINTGASHLWIGYNNGYSAPFDGEIDEVGIWSRVLTGAEILQLYNGGTGLTYTGSFPPTITLNFPIAYYNSTSSTITFNATVTSSLVVTNVSLYLDGVLNETNSSGINATDYLFTKILSEGNHNWSINSCNANGCVNSSTRILSIDTIYPKITLNYPTSIIDYGYINQTMQLNWSVQEEVLDKCWYNYNGTNVTLSSCSNTTNNLANITLNTNKSIVLWANDTFGNTNSTVWNWDYGAFENGRSYDASNYETNLSLFVLNVSRATGYNLITPYLNYNGIDYLVSNISNSGQNSVLYKTLYLPLNNNSYSTKNNTFYWKMNSTNGVTTYPITTTSSNQTVNPLILTLCNATYPVKALNFTGYDEKYQTTLVPITFDGAFNYWIGDGSIIKQYYYQNLTTGTSNWNFCISPNTTIQTDMQSSFTNPSYLPRTYYLSNASITNTSSNIKILMLNSSVGVKFYFTLEKGGIRISNSTITISKKNIGTGLWDVIGIRESDSQGEFIEYLELDKEYSYSIVQNGIPLGIVYKTSSCSSAPCLVTLNLDDGVSYNQWAGYYNEYAQNVVYNLDYYPDSKIINFTFLDITGLANYFRLQVDKVNFENASNNICNTTLYATQGTITCNVTGQTGNFVATGTISRSPEKIVAVITGVLSAIADVIGKNLGLFITVLLIILVGIVGAYNPVVGIILTAMALIFSVILGLVSLSLTSVILVVILAIILIIKNGRYNV